MKKRFLDELKRHLQPLGRQEREEILRFYEEHFHAGITYEGLSEDEIVERLETPKQIARNVLREYGISMKETPEEDDAGVRVGGVIAIILFDFLAISVIYPALLSFFVGMVSGFATFTFGWILASQASVWGVLFRLGVGFFLLLFVVWLYDIIVGFTAWLIRWHMRVFNIPHAKKTAKAMRKAQASTALRKYPALRRTRNTLSLVAVVLIVFGGVFSVVARGEHPFRFGEAALVEENYDFDMSDAIAAGETWHLEGEMEIGSVILKRTATASIRIHSLEREDASVTVIYDEDANVLRFENAYERSFHFYINIFGSFRQPELTIEIPETLAIGTIDMKTANSKMTIDHFVAAEVSLSTSNATIEIRHLDVSDALTLKTSNGRIRLFDSVADTIVAETSNGRIVGERLHADRYTFNSSNGRIELDSLNDAAAAGSELDVTTSNGNIDLGNVYVRRVDLRTSNGDIDYFNDDLTFILDALETRTSNGDVKKNVPYHHGG